MVNLPQSGLIHWNVHTIMIQNWIISKMSVRGVWSYWLYRGKEKMGIFGSNDEARAKANELEAGP